MTFPVEMTATMTGATVGQLAYWRRTDLLVPEIERTPRALYSFRDLVALRSFVHLRRTVSLQSVRKAFSEMRRMDLTDHPSQYKLVAQGRSIVLVLEQVSVDLVAQPGHEVLATLEDVFAPFTTKKGRKVVDFTRPRPHLEVREGRMAGWPTIQGTRVPYDQVAALVADGSVRPEQVRRFYPTVSPEAVSDAVDFDAEVKGARSAS